MATQTNLVAHRLRLWEAEDALDKRQAHSEPATVAQQLDGREAYYASIRCPSFSYHW